jgi:hypothetical protein
VGQRDEAKMGCGSGSIVEIVNSAGTGTALRPSLYNPTGQGAILSAVNQESPKENEE